VPARRRKARPAARSLAQGVLVLLLAGGGTVALAAADRREQSAPRAAATAAAGSLSHANSRNGHAIFTASNIGPGHGTMGSVTITNTGALPGFFLLTQYGITDTPGPGGGALSSRMNLVIREKKTGAVVYAGKLSGLGTRAAGIILPGAARTYSFAASLPNGGPADNALQGSQLGVGYRWLAEPITLRPRPRPAPDALPSLADRRPPRVLVRVRHRQRVLERGYVLLRMRCSESCRVRSSADWRFGPGKRVNVLVRPRRAHAGRWTSLKIRLRRSDRPALRQALLQHRRPAVRLRVSARDKAGNELVFLRRIVFVRARP
jgi:hypothetical protein